MTGSSNTCVSSVLASLLPFKVRSVHETPSNDDEKTYLVTHSAKKAPSPIVPMELIVFGRPKSIDNQSDSPVELESADHPRYEYRAAFGGHPLANDDAVNEELSK
eukprot:CAMPEP_0197022900 /NCGR_PEP_ID=MMETSP1384-20130603/3706_1 /TAXON_ID=29189 /ORGANISM="Ammonia sp." /LENGTH=104 /DNA_ID=CAMNT_0042451021 /DNA_START=322 /DNA_END=636 /DNA_ORIENTATION=+